MSPAGAGLIPDSARLALPVEQNGKIGMKKQADIFRGVILHLTEWQYSALVATWQFELPESYESSFDSLIECGYVAVSVNDRWRAIGTITKWCIGTRDNGSRLATVGCISKDVSGLEKEGIRYLDELLWLTAGQKDAVLGALESDSKKYRPSELPLGLDLDAAADAIARRYDVGSDQVQISIHRKNQSVSSTS